MDVTLFSRNDFTVEIILTPFPKTKKEEKMFKVSESFLSNSLLPSGYSSDDHASPFRQKKKNKTNEEF